MSRKTIPKDDIPPIIRKKDAQIEKMKAELKKVCAELGAEKKKRRRIVRKNKEEVNRMRHDQWRIEDTIHRNNLSFEAEIERKKEEFVKTRTKLITLKLETDEKLQDEVLKKDQETTELMEQRNKELTEAVENGSDRKSWRECERCSLEFEEDGDRVPKFLKCGDTLCWGCIKQLAHPDFIMCPFDGTIFVFSENDNINHLKKNFKALSEL